MGTGLLRTIHSRVSWMCFPVERSITVSAPQRMAHVILSTSSAMDDVTAELPMLQLIFTRKIAADDHRLCFRVVDVGRDDRAAARHFIAHEFGRDDLGQGRAERLP